MSSNLMFVLTHSRHGDDVSAAFLTPRLDSNPGFIGSTVDQLFSYAFSCATFLAQLQPHKQTCLQIRSSPRKRSFQPFLMFSRFARVTPVLSRQYVHRMSTISQPRIRKRLIVCCDGTWQSSVSGERNIPSNVTRMCRHLEKGNVVDKDGVTWQQTVHYDAGIGTGDLTILERSLQGGTGAGLSKNVIEAYNFLVLNYQPGDRVYCFGFSRGAYTARALAGFITSFGICSPMDMQAFPQTYTMYEEAVPYQEGEKLSTKQKREALYGKGWTGGAFKENSYAEKWLHGKDITVELRTGTMAPKYDIRNRKTIVPLDRDHGYVGLSEWVSEYRTKKNIPDPVDGDDSRHVEVVGVWDTVGALGVPKIFGWLKLPFHILDKPSREFHDVTISANIHHAYHALALDERRRPFSPSVWYVPHGQPRPEELKQVWFPGVHINIGGGSDDVLEDQKGDFEQIANITFAWMTEQVRPHLTFAEETFETAIQDQLALLAAVDGRPYPWPSSLTGKISSAPIRLLYLISPKLAAKVSAKPGWGIGNIIDSFVTGGLVMLLGGAAWRTPGECKAPTDITSRHDEKLITGANGLGYTGEMIHPCVQYRRNTKFKLPPSVALKAWDRHLIKNGWEWRKQRQGNSTDVVVIPEYQIALEDPSVDVNARISKSNPRNMERLVAERNGAREFLEELDERIYGVRSDEMREMRNGDGGKRANISVRGVEGV